MASSSTMVSKRQLTEGGEEEEEIHENNNNKKKNNDEVAIATHLCLKPQTNGAPLDREVVLRRIRHRKRVRNVKNAVQALLTSPFSSNKLNSHDKSAVSRVKWVDDAFAAL